MPGNERRYERQLEEVASYRIDPTTWWSRSFYEPRVRPETVDSWWSDWAALWADVARVHEARTFCEPDPPIRQRPKRKSDPRLAKEMYNERDQNRLTTLDRIIARHWSNRLIALIPHVDSLRRDTNDASTFTYAVSPPASWSVW